MKTIKGTEPIISPLQESALNKKGLCDYVINIASGCLHGCTFCYVPSTPAIRTKQLYLQEKGVENPQMDWGQYLFIRQEIPEQLEKILSRKKTWLETPAGKGVVLLCSGTDPYQNQQTANITREIISILLKYNRRIRILTRSPLWIKDIEFLTQKNLIIGMSLPYLNDELSKQIEPSAPLPSQRYRTLIAAREAGCRLYVAVAPTPPQMTLDDFKQHLEKIMFFNPEVIFWEPINARGVNGKRMLAAGNGFASSIMNKRAWAKNFIRQWRDIQTAASQLGCSERLHIWVDFGLKGFVEQAELNNWLYRPTVEKWENYTDSKYKLKQKQNTKEEMD